MTTPLPTPPQIELLLGLFRAALAAADPLQVVPPHLPASPKGRTVVVGMGKAAGAMAQAVERNWPGPLEGVVVVPAGGALPLQQIRLLEGSHPVPDVRSVAAGQALIDAVEGLTADDLVIALVSGGGSALCSLPAPGLQLADKQQITRELLQRGATISEMNTVRRHLSAIKGGRLAAKAHPARLVSLLISDIPGDDPALIASGPTLPDPSTCADALAVLRRYAITASPSIRSALETGRWESPKPGDKQMQGNDHRLVACAWDGLVAAANEARKRGFNCHILSDSMEGEAKEMAKAHAALALNVVHHGEPFAAPCILLSGGEATVTVHGTGRGGRNTEFMLALSMVLGQTSTVHALSAGTDGLDGNGDGAGAWWTSSLWPQVQALPQRAAAYLANNDSHSFFDSLGAVIRTGPTFTNINDFRALLIEA